MIDTIIFKSVKYCALHLKERGRCTAVHSSNITHHEPLELPSWYDAGDAKETLILRRWERWSANGHRWEYSILVVKTYYLITDFWWNYVTGGGDGDELASCNYGKNTVGTVGTYTYIYHHLSRQLPICKWTNRDEYNRDEHLAVNTG